MTIWGIPLWKVLVLCLLWDIGQAIGRILFELVLTSI